MTVFSHIVQHVSALAAYGLWGLVRDRARDMVAAMASHAREGWRIRTNDKKMGMLGGHGVKVKDISDKV